MTNPVIIGDARLRRCYSCGETKPLSLFHRDSSMPLGRAYKCAVCDNQQARARRTRTPRKKRVVSWRPNRRERDGHIPCYSSRPTTIYGLFDGVSGACRYVGKTCGNLRSRLAQHLRQSRRGITHLQKWVAKCLRLGTTPAFTVLEVVPAAKDWCEAEKRWIRAMRSAGCSLTNATAGGEGLSDLIFTAGHRSKIAARLRTGQYLRCSRCGTPFYRKRSAILAGKPSFCSRDCSNRRSVSAA